jgi:hypothetical protein
MPQTEISADSSDEPTRSRVAQDHYEYLLRPAASSVPKHPDDGEQPWLFPQGDLVVPDTVLRMRKSVAAIHAVPVAGDTSLNTRRIFDALILAAQMDLRVRGAEMMARIKNDRVSPYFEVRITELARLAGIKGKNYKRIYDDLDEIFDMRMDWNVVGEDAAIEWSMKAHFLSTYGRGTGQNAGLIRFSIDPAILVIVLDPANWATLSLQVLRGMPTLASYQLYQNVWRYINTTHKKTAALPVETWIDLILGPSRFVKVDPKTKKKVANDYRDFKRRYLVDAIERVNSTQALDHTIELKEIRSGNRVAKLEFFFTRKSQQRLVLPVAWDTSLIDRLRVMGFSSQDISEISQRHTADHMTRALLLLAVAKDRLARGGDVMGREREKPYLLGILQKLPEDAVKGDPGLSLDDDEQRRLLEQQRSEEERATRLAEEFSLHNRECFRRAMQEGPAEIVKGCRAQFESSASFTTNKFVIERFGWESVPALLAVNGWLRDNEPELYVRLLPLPHEREFEAWLATASEKAEPQQLGTSDPAA